MSSHLLILSLGWLISITRPKMFGKHLNFTDMKLNGTKQEHNEVFL